MTTAEQLAAIDLDKCGEEKLREIAQEAIAGWSAAQARIDRRAAWDKACHTFVHGADDEEEDK